MLISIIIQADVVCIIMDTLETSLEGACIEFTPGDVMLTAYLPYLCYIQNSCLGLEATEVNKQHLLSKNSLPILLVVEPYPNCTKDVHIVQAVSTSSSSGKDMCQDEDA